MDLAVSIIIPTIKARPDYLDRCVAECERTKRPEDEILVIEGGTFGANCNYGAANASNPILLFLNDDTKPDQDDWLDRLTDPFSDPTVGVVGVRLIYPTGMIQHAGVYFENDQTGLVARNYTYDRPSGPVDAVTGAALAIRAPLFAQLDGFDTAYVNGYEDIDLCIRACHTNTIIWYTADCTIIHHESASGAARWTHTGHNIALLQGRYQLAD